jgi:hypothetical protein
LLFVVRGCWFVVVFLLLASSVYAAVPVSLANLNASSSNAAQIAQLEQVIIVENQRTRDYMTSFGEETQRQFILAKNDAEREIRSILMMFKFTLAITVFCAFLAALFLGDLFHYRRERRYRMNLSRDEAGYEKALKVQANASVVPSVAAPVNPLPPPLPQRRMSVLGVVLLVFFVIASIVLAVVVVLQSQGVSLW